MTAEGAT